MSDDNKFYEVVEAKLAEYDRAIAVGQELLAGLQEQRDQVVLIRDAMLTVEANAALYQGKIEQYQQGQS
jgi:hypothetical protein